jgi:hypothetical protein
MTKEEIIELAYKATESEIILGTLYEAIKVECVNIYLMSFAKLIAEKEREECAKIADEYAEGLERNYSELIADKIRARGQE